VVCLLSSVHMMLSDLQCELLSVKSCYGCSCWIICDGVQSVLAYCCQFTFMLMIDFMMAWHAKLKLAKTCPKISFYWFIWTEIGFSDDLFASSNSCLNTILLVALFCFLEHVISITSSNCYLLGLIVIPPCEVHNCFLIINWMAAVSVMLVHALVASHQWLNHHVSQTIILMRTDLYDDFSPSQWCMVWGSNLDGAWIFVFQLTKSS
jgi:hypothetical protein